MHHLIPYAPSPSYELSYDFFPDPLHAGHILVYGWHNHGVVFVNRTTWSGVSDIISRFTNAHHNPGGNRELIECLNDALVGKPQRFSQTLLLHGSLWHQKIWSEIATVPFGKTITYTELAARAGNPSAVRATASACGANPFPLLIPCHRVIGKDGSLTGYAWGLNYKKQLLDREARYIRKSQTAAA
jgi:methylated-DNA-[protein]-cysteine S-methyltransferase